MIYTRVFSVNSVKYWFADRNGIQFTKIVQTEIFSIPFDIQRM